MTAPTMADGRLSAALRNRTALGRAEEVTGVVLPVDGGITASTGQPNLTVLS